MRRSGPNARTGLRAREARDRPWEKRAPPPPQEALAGEAEVAAPGTGRRFVELEQVVGRDVRSLKKLHARVLTLGLGRDVTLGFEILICYASLGVLPKTSLCFQGFLNDDLSQWSSAMVGIFRAGYPEEAILLHRGLKLRQIGLDEKAITFGLKSCAELRNLLLGKGMHADSLKLGLSRDKFVGSSLVGLYSKLARMADSHKVFEEILDKDIVSYTSMITGYSENMDSTSWNAFKIASDMLRSNLEVNRVTLVSLLQVSGNLGAIREGKSVHSYSVRRGIGVSDEVLETSLVHMYTRCGAYQLASAVLKNSMQSVASWNALLAGLVRTGQSGNAIHHFSVMLHEHKAIPDSVTYANVISACAELRNSVCAASVHAYLIRRSIHLDVVLATALIEVYFKCTRTMRSRRLFDQLTVRDVVSYNAMIYGYLQSGMANEAITLLKEMMAECIAPNSVTVLSLLAAIADHKDFIRGRWIHGFAIRHGFCSDVDIANQIIRMYSGCGKIAAARIVFASLEKKNLISWTAMMMGCLFCGNGGETVRLLQLMQQHGEKPDSVTVMAATQAASELGHLKGVKQIHCFVYRALLEKDTKTANSLIIAYAKCGRLDLSVGLFLSLENRDLDSWNAMISAYGMHGFYIKVLEMFKLMEEGNINPDGLTFSSVLSACSHAGLVKEGLRIFQVMTSMYSVLPQEEHYGCIVDLLSRAGHLEEGYKLIKLSTLNDRSSVLCALLSACRTHGNTILGQIISDELLELEQNPGTYALISEVFAQKGQWNKSASIRNIAKESGLRKLPGSSFIESVEKANNLR
ncbi:pentatricopeptide repeat-containing protein [Panicum miliaceum]|uniref:Pentatricopeptide repeat-containing protein n=1 Tax=Panicum miliaceum TaxID=4540 RepID=A0A3L6TIK4_PANMI|nr:pentatricopeptide repeat-containing protein [Panicum miliaceum]